MSGHAGISDGPESAIACGKWDVLAGVCENVRLCEHKVEHVHSPCVLADAHRKVVRLYVAADQPSRVEELYSLQLFA